MRRSVRKMAAGCVARASYPLKGDANWSQRLGSSAPYTVGPAASKSVLPGGWGIRACLTCDSAANVLGEWPSNLRAYRHETIYGEWLIETTLSHFSRAAEAGSPHLPAPAGELPASYLRPIQWKGQPPMVVSSGFYERKNWDRFVWMRSRQSPNLLKRFLKKEITRFGQTRTIGGIVASLLAVALFFTTDARADAAQDLFAKASPSSTQVVDHSAWDRLLKTYVKPGSDGLNRVDYAAFRRSGHNELKHYLRELEKINPRKLNRAEQFALLANLYNATTIDIVLDHYPVKSIKDISLGGGLISVFSGGPWKSKVLKMKGVELSLDDIEHKILRPIFKDPRVHYAVNCASIGCPNLGIDAFVGAKLNQQLDAAARAYVNHPRGVRIRGSNVAVSSIYSWFKADFGGTDRAVVAHVRKYAAPTLAQKLRSASSISYQTYDWGLNDVGR
jgi:hypothetical protein